MSRLRKVPKGILCLTFIMGVTVFAGTEHQSSGQTILKPEILGVLIPESGPYTAPLEAQIEKLDRALTYPKSYGFSVKKIKMNPRSVHEAAEEFARSGIHFIFLALGNFDSEGILLTDNPAVKVVVDPFLVNPPSALSFDLVTWDFPAGIQGEKSGAWAARKFQRAWILHSRDSGPDLDMALGFERVFKKQARGKVLLERSAFQDAAVVFETYKDLLKKLSPEVIFMPSSRPETIRSFNTFLKAQNYSGTVLGSQGWFMSESVKPGAKDWIGRLVVSTYPGPFTKAAAETPGYSALKEALDWTAGCMSKKAVPAITECLQEVPEGGTRAGLKGGGHWIRRKKGPQLWELNEGGPLKFDNL